MNISSERDSSTSSCSSCSSSDDGGETLKIRSKEGIRCGLNHGKSDGQEKNYIQPATHLYIKRTSDRSLNRKTKLSRKDG